MATNNFNQTPDEYKLNSCNPWDASCAYGSDFTDFNSLASMGGSRGSYTHPLNSDVSNQIYNNNLAAKAAADNGNWWDKFKYGVGWTTQDSMGRSGLGSSSFGTGIGNSLNLVNGVVNAAMIPQKFEALGLDIKGKRAMIKSAEKDIEAKTYAFDEMQKNTNAQRSAFSTGGHPTFSKPTATV
jgi:hypothetical protein